VKDDLFRWSTLARWKMKGNLPPLPLSSPSPCPTPNQPITKDRNKRKFPTFATCKGTQIQERSTQSTVHIKISIQSGVYTLREIQTIQRVYT
jgi:hypothetical protein